MPRGRFLDRDLSTNRQYWSMSADYRNFWDLLILWLDPLGRIDGDARIIKGIVCPLADWTVEQIEEMLVKFESLERSNGLGWITRYHAKGIYCLWASGFHSHQKGLQISHEAKGKYDGYSNIPPPPKKLLKGVEPVIEDNSFIEGLRPSYPHLDLDEEWEKCKLWWSEGNRDMKRPKSAFINWLSKAKGSKQLGPESVETGDKLEGFDIGGANE